MGQETGRGISGGYEGNCQTHFFQKFKSKEPRFSETSSARCIWVWLLVVVCLLQYILTYAFRRGVEMHGDFTGGVGSMAWLGMASAGWGVEDRMHLDGI